MSFADTVVLFVLALLLFGPKKLPVIARQIGKALNEFKRASNEFKSQIEAEISQLEYQERQQKREQEQNRQLEQTILPPTPPAGSLPAARFSVQPEVPAAPAPVSPEVEPAAHNTTNA